MVIVKNTDYLSQITGPHASQPVYELVPKQDAKKVALLIHGRGASPIPFLEWGGTELIDTRILAPQAFNNTWYPHRFVVPQEQNQPHLTSALAVLDALVATMLDQGYVHSDILLAGFSQGACLAAEFLKRYPNQYGGVAIMSGGLIGTDQEAANTAITKSLVEVPVYIGCDEVDFHIPWSRVEMTAHILKKASAKVQLKKYAKFGHQIHPDAENFLQSLL